MKGCDWLEQMGEGFKREGWVGVEPQRAGEHSQDLVLDDINPIGDVKVKPAFVRTSNTK